MGAGLSSLNSALVLSCAHSSPGEKHTALSWAKCFSFREDLCGVGNGSEAPRPASHVTGHALQYVPVVLHLKSSQRELTPAEDAAALGQYRDREDHEGQSIGLREVAPPSAQQKTHQLWPMLASPSPYGKWGCDAHPQMAVWKLLHS